MDKEVVEIVRKLSKRYEMTIFSHCYRYNKIIDLYRGGYNVFVIPEQKHYKVNVKEMYDFIVEKLEIHKDYAKFERKGKQGIMYQEFINKKELLQEQNAFKPENYHWKNNLEKMSDDYLYFLVHGESIKIGRTVDPISRGRQIATSLDGQFSLYVVPNKGFLEKTMHNCFAEYRKGGEWFSYSDRIIDFAKKTNAKFIHCKEFTRR